LLFLFSLFLQQVRGYSAVETGLILLPQAVAVVLFAQVCGRLYPRIGPRRLLLTSLTLTAASAGLFLLVDLNTSTVWLIAFVFLNGIGLAFTFIPLQASTFSTISIASMGR